MFTKYTSQWWGSMIKKVLNQKSPLWWRKFLISKLSPHLYRKNCGLYVTSEYWDYLIILDACRYDTFEREVRKRKLEGKLEYRISRASMTSDFLLENFGKGKFTDIIYITANPFVDMLLKGKFYKIVSVWKDGWNYELNTVHPKTMYEYTLETLEKYPNKKMIIHFMQPHFPYLTLKLSEETGFRAQREAILTGKDKWRDVTIWDLVAQGKVKLEKVKKAYVENLQIVLDYVEKLLKHLNGKIVITSDHGEAFGEIFHPIVPIRIYGHPKNVRIEALVKVPWFIIEKEKEIVDEEKQKISNAVSKFLRKEKLSLVKGS